MKHRWLNPWIIRLPIFRPTVNIDRSWEAHKKPIFLTIDDGPNPASTPQWLEILSKHHAKATFFCLGNRLEQFPSLADDIRRQGHLIANHGYDHLDGWKIRRHVFYDNLKRGEIVSRSRMFRPPYGHFTVSQWWFHRKDAQWVLWDYLVPDFLPQFHAEPEALKLIQCIQPKNIIVMHDQLRNHKPRMVFLDQLCMELTNRQFVFETL